MNILSAEKSKLEKLRRIEGRKVENGKYDEAMAELSRITIDTAKARTLLAEKVNELEIFRTEIDLGIGA